MRKILVAGGLTAAAVAAVIGAASTNSIGGFDSAAHQTVGYSSADIDGTAVDSVVYNVDSSDESKLSSVDITFHAAVVEDSVIQIGFGDPSSSPLANCVDTQLTAGKVPAGGVTSVSCTVSENITDASKFRLFVTGPAQS
jgi:hypothetical protein